MTVEREEHAERFDPEQSSGLLVDAEHRARYAIAASLAAGRRVLDAGCGTGYGTQMLARERPDELAAIDVSEDAVARTRAAVGDGADVVCADIRDLPFTDASF